MSFRCNKALFLDLDGTIIITKTGSPFPVDEEDWRFLPKILDRIKYYSDEGFVICIVTNQGGIEMGYTTKECIESKLNKITQEIEQAIGASVNTVYCPYMDGYHRKPYPGMAYTLAVELSLDLAASIMVGDANSDRDFAKNAGIGKFEFATDFTQVYDNDIYKGKAV